ncbi:hypothetical protein M6I34_15295 [Burkholderiaceae bacterium FT117]|uniref:nitric oxide reductase activation protein NorD n=1 Tax=Zeimonas sediminis TaxID=2944268 RepID=UPI002342C478|nr:hypothetical protein [Zeimonas sediminis]MCM5571884.1 hypothetical protein [Zeimonas sediminis]
MQAAPGHLRPYLRALWGRSTTVATLPAAAARSVLDADTLRVPLDVARDRRLALAAAAHAGAHRAHGGPPFERGALKPVQQALVGLLEDARVEWLAARELPGLRRLWLGFHSAGPDSGNGFETLLQRLARSLLDPAYVDPHPWVRKGRAMFFADADGRALALPDATALRRAASLLGNDIGQMRLQFNARLYLVEPGYRDDNRHLWIDEAEDAELRAPRQEQAADGEPHRPDSPEPSQDEASVRYPEWDRLIARHRRRWARVVERTAAEATDSPAAGGLQAELGRQASLARRLTARLVARRVAPASGARERVFEGDEFDPAALVDAQVARRMRRVPDSRVYMRQSCADAPIAFAILLDASASTARPAGTGHGDASVLEVARVAALLCAAAVEAAGHRCEVSAFRSCGRDEVEVLRIKASGERAGAPVVVARAAGLDSRWSTRTGAAVRHMAAALARRPAGQRRLILLTDGEPWDIDVHDPRYLTDDLRMAVREAAGAGVGVACLDFGAAAAERATSGLDPEPARADSPRRAFAPGAWREVRRLDMLPAAFAALVENGVQ